jgi:hypothetical protein
LFTPSRTKRHFSERDARALLKVLGECRQACVSAMSIAPIGGEAYRAADAVLEAIDGAAEALVGDRRAFLPPHHGGPYDGVRVPRIWERSPVLEAAILEVLRASAVGNVVEGERLREVAGRLAAAVLAIPSEPPTS